MLSARTLWGNTFAAVRTTCARSDCENRPCVIPCSWFCALDLTPTEWLHGQEHTDGHIRFAIGDVVGPTSTELHLRFSSHVSGDMSWWHHANHLGHRMVRINIAVLARGYLQGGYSVVAPPRRLLKSRFTVAQREHYVKAFWRGLTLPHRLGTPLTRPPASFTALPALARLWVAGAALLPLQRHQARRLRTCPSFALVEFCARHDWAPWAHPHLWELCRLWGFQPGRKLTLHQSRGSKKKSRDVRGNVISGEEHRRKFVSKKSLLPPHHLHTTVRVNNTTQRLQSELASHSRAITHSPPNTNLIKLTPKSRDILKGHVELRGATGTSGQSVFWGMELLAPSATAASLAACFLSVDSTPDRTRTHAHFSCWACRISFLFALCMAQDVLGWKESASSFCAHFHFVPWCRCWTSLTVLSHKSYPHQPVQDPDLQRLLHPWEEASGKTPTSPLAKVRCLANPAPNTGHEPTPPTSSGAWTQRTRRSISPTTSTISSARTTLPWSPPQI